MLFINIMDSKSLILIVLLIILIINNQKSSREEAGDPVNNLFNSINDCGTNLSNGKLC